MEFYLYAPSGFYASATVTDVNGLSSEAKISQCASTRLARLLLAGNSQLASDETAKTTTSPDKTRSRQVENGSRSKGERSCRIEQANVACRNWYTPRWERAKAQEMAVRWAWDFVVGPVVALLPKRWRDGVLAGREVSWGTAATLSGMYESIGAVVAFGYWYLFEMGRLMTELIAANAKSGAGASEIQIGGTALTLFYFHPVTWLLLGMFFEGAVRLCSAAFAGNVVGSLPLVIVERAAFWMRYARKARVIGKNAKSFAGAVRERARIAMAKEVADQVESSGTGTDEVVEIRASRRKDEWIAPRVVRMGEGYYRLEENWVGGGERPFCYRLRRLEAGVPGRNVILYERE